MRLSLVQRTFSCSPKVRTEYLGIYITSNRLILTSYWLKLEHKSTGKAMQFLKGLDSTPEVAEFIFSESQDGMEYRHQKNIWSGLEGERGHAQQYPISYPLGQIPT